MTKPGWCKLMFKDGFESGIAFHTGFFRVLITSGEERVCSLSDHDIPTRERGSKMQEDLLTKQTTAVILFVIF